MIAFQGQQKMGFVRDDLGGDVDLTPQGVDGDERAFELAGFGRMIERFGNGGADLLLRGCDKPCNIGVDSLSLRCRIL
jgi:hypothetical protein